MKPATLLLYCVVVVGTSLLANMDFGQLGTMAASQEQMRDFSNDAASKSGQATRKSKTQTT